MLRAASAIVASVEPILLGMTGSMWTARSFRLRAAVVLRECCPEVTYRDSICEILSMCPGTRNCENMMSDVAPCLFNLAVMTCSMIYDNFCRAQIWSLAQR